MSKETSNAGGPPPGLGGTPDFDFKVRTDTATRDIVDEAIASIPQVGLRGAAQFLETNKVPAEVAVRVLVYPKLRRSR